MRWALLALIVVFLGVVGLIYAKTTDRERVDAKVAAGDRYWTTTPAELQRHYNENVVGADSDFLDKVVRMDARVTAILKTHKGRPYLGLDVGDPKNTMVAVFDDDTRDGELRALGELHVGQTTTLQCVCKGRKTAEYPNTVMLQSCHLVP